MKLIKTTPFILLIVLSIACNTNVKDIQTLITIELQKEVSQKIKLSNIALIDSIKIIDINGFQEFGEVKSAMWLNDKLILHTSSPKTVTLLNSNGRAIHQIGLNHIINDITSINVVGNKVYVLDRGLLKMHVFDENLKAKNKFSIPFFSQSFNVLNDSTIVFYTGNEKTDDNEGKLIFYDVLNEVVMNDLLPILDIQQKYFHFLTTYHFNNFNGKTIFWDSSIDTIYSINDGGITPIISLDYGSSGLPIDFYKNAQFDNAYDFVTQMRKKGYAYRHFKILSNRNYMLIVFEKGGDFLQHYTAIMRMYQKHLKTLMTTLFLIEI